MKKEVLIINYHRIERGGTLVGKSRDDFYSVTEKEFLQQVKFMVRGGIQLISLDDVVNHRLPDGLSVAITVDDGNGSDYQVIFPVLAENGIPATFFWMADTPGSDPKWMRTQQMQMDGFLFGSHGISHRDFTLLKKDEQLSELQGSKKILEENTGNTVNYLAFPYGQYDETLIQQAREAGYKAVFATGFKQNFPEPGSFLFHRWSLKRTTGKMHFERMLTDSTYREIRIKELALRQTVRKKVETTLSGRMKFSKR
jgi:peptidoglycan/xylan/chitin deacetylase (PgdA/CDA1 family)